MTANVPEGMSSADAFTALYIKAEVHGIGNFHPYAGKAPGSRWNAVQLFKTYCRNNFCNYVRGKPMKVNFSQFPALDVSGYDKQYGQGAAQKAMDTYKKTWNTLDTEEKYDLKGKPCQYFTSYWRQRTPPSQRKDLEFIFHKCEQLEGSKEKAEQQISKNKPSWIFKECRAKYTLISPGSSISHKYKPCRKALSHFKMYSLSQETPEPKVRQFSICNYNPILPFLRRYREYNDISIATAIKILDPQTPES